MTKKPTKQGAETPVGQMAHLMGEMTEVALAGQAVGLKIIAAEMQVLSHLMPQATPASDPQDKAEPQDHGAAGPAGKTDAEIEAGFDNMPI